MTFQEYLKSSVAATLPDSFVDTIGSALNCSLTDNIDEVSPILKYRALARVYLFLATAPNVSEGGVSISYTATEKKLFLDLARRYAGLAGETGLIVGTAYGYKGQNI